MTAAEIDRIFSDPLLVFVARQRGMATGTAWYMFTTRAPDNRTVQCGLCDKRVPNWAHDIREHGAEHLREFQGVRYDAIRAALLAGSREVAVAIWEDPGDADA